MTLEQLRAAIDGVDDRIIGLLGERASLVEEVGRVKEKSGDSYYAPEREENLFAPLGRNQHEPSAGSGFARHLPRNPFLYAGTRANNQSGLPRTADDVQSPGGSSPLWQCGRIMS